MVVVVVVAAVVVMMQVIVITLLLLFIVAGTMPSTLRTSFYFIFTTTLDKVGVNTSILQMKEGDSEILHTVAELRF